MLYILLIDAYKWLSQTVTSTAFKYVFTASIPRQVENLLRWLSLNTERYDSHQMLSNWYVREI